MSWFTNLTIFLEGIRFKDWVKHLKRENEFGIRRGKNRRTDFVVCSWIDSSAPWHIHCCSDNYIGICHTGVDSWSGANKKNLLLIGGKVNCTRISTLPTELQFCALATDSPCYTANTSSYKAAPSDAAYRGVVLITLISAHPLAKSTKEMKPNLKSLHNMKNRHAIDLMLRRYAEAATKTLVFPGNRIIIGAGSLSAAKSTADKVI